MIRFLGEEALGRQLSLCPCCNGSLYRLNYLSVYSVEAGSCHVAQDILKLIIHLPHLPGPGITDTCNCVWSYINYITTCPQLLLLSPSCCNLKLILSIVSALLLTTKTLEAVISCPCSMTGHGLVKMLSGPSPAFFICCPHTKAWVPWGPGAFPYFPGGCGSCVTFFRTSGYSCYHHLSTLFPGPTCKNATALPKVFFAIVSLLILLGLEPRDSGIPGSHNWPIFQAPF